MRGYSLWELPSERVHLMGVCQEAVLQARPCLSQRCQESFYCSGLYRPPP